MAQYPQVHSTIKGGVVRVKDLANNQTLQQKIRDNTPGSVKKHYNLVKEGYKQRKDVWIIWINTIISLI